MLIEAKEKSFEVEIKALKEFEKMKAKEIEHYMSKVHEEIKVKKRKKESELRM